MVSYFFIVLWTFMAVGFALLFGQKQIMTYFNLVDKRLLIGDKSSQKMAQMMKVADVSTNYYHYSTLSNFSLRISQDRNKDETINSRFEGNNPDEVIKRAYDWAVERGIVTKE